MFKNSPKTKSIVLQVLKDADIEVGGTRPWDIRVNNDQFYNRLLAEGALGLGESYMDGWWETDDLSGLTYRLIKSNAKDKVNPGAKLLLWALKPILSNRQSLKRSKQVIDKHYDLGNDLYMSFLDPYNQYTCGYFKDTDDLNAAQIAKMELICRKLQLKPTDKVLDIGCGWGGFAKYAAEKYGCHVTGISISDEQIKYAQEFVKGLPVDIINLDYRHVTDKFDKVVSVGMFEHVGYKNYREFMEVVKRVTKEDGLFLLHSLGYNYSTKAGDPWVDKYIFPNGMAPSIPQIGSAIEKLFVMEDWHNFGVYYEKTLQAWFKNFETNWPKLKEKYDDRFFRMFKFYLLGFVGAIRARDLQLWQIVLSPNGVPGGYKSIR